MCYSASLCSSEGYSHNVHILISHSLSFRSHSSTSFFFRNCDRTREVRRLRVFETRFLRRIFGPKRDENGK